LLEVRFTKEWAMVARTSLQWKQKGRAAANESACREQFRFAWLYLRTGTRTQLAALRPKVSAFFATVNLSPHLSAK
jgi:hypothetical protein